MSLKDDLTNDITAIIQEQWTKRDGRVVPDLASLTLRNDAVSLDATVLYADLADSTAMVDTYKAHFSAEVYKAFLRAAAKVVRFNAGVITAYDGDRIMAVYVGDNKNTAAVTSALMIKSAVADIIQPALRKQYPTHAFNIRHVVGIDTSPLFVAKTGVVGSNDLVWVGRAANYAAKLSTLSHEYSTIITDTVHQKCATSVKLDSTKTDVWQAARWNNYNNSVIYRTNASIRIV